MSALEAPTWPVELPQHLSATQLNMFDRCPEQFRNRYILKKRERPGAALIIGRADHAAAEHNYRQKITSGVDLPISEVEDAYADAYEAAIDEHGGDTEIAWGDENYTRAKDDGARLVRAYHEQVAPSVQPIAVEREIFHSIPQVPVALKGFIDVETTVSVIERKTTKRAESKPKGQWRLQGMIYRAALRKPVEWQLSIRGKSARCITRVDAPELVLPWVDGCDQLANRYVGRIIRQLHATYVMYGPDAPWPGAISHDWGCSFCGYRPHCAWWAA